MSDFIIDCSSPEELKAALLRLIDTVPNAVADALWNEASIVMNESKDLTPIKTGYLRGSGYVKDPTVNGRDISVELGYSADYAIYVHENLEAHHEVGQAKFLEQPILEHVDTLSADIVQRVVDGMEG